jgi:hypothetical protein
MTQVRSGMPSAESLRTRRFLDAQPRGAVREDRVENRSRCAGIRHYVDRGARALCCAV